ncbi:MAG: radical SAM protein [Candidatus Thiodiazotropha taylori]|uniref:Radical SAM protein n=1 Tax=Candidatus Thiodiazotropha taylori TaxID=2792791 RepID=A0A9E4KCQ3_9GAMM|nr:radical SAM protein [Candidatus Thiodiazotropha taylori]MCW4256338.1 radical SAM protein [Candidatus Thiodiazotropha taylori]
MDIPARPEAALVQAAPPERKASAVPDVRYRLEPHNVFNLDSSTVALLAKAHRGWVVLDRRDYQLLQSIFTASEAGDERCLSFSVPILERLHSVGLVAKNGDQPEHCRMQEVEHTGTLLIKMTGACNYACTYCYDYSPERAGHHVSVEHATEIIDALMSIGGSLNVTFHGGEPLLRFKEVKRLVEHCRSHHPDNTIRFTMQSNGSLLTEEVVAFLTEHNFSLGISLDGLDATTDQLRPPKDSKNTASEVFYRLLREFPDFIRNRCGVLTVLSAANIYTFTDFALWLQDEGVNGLSFTILDPVGRAGENSGQIVQPDDLSALYGTLVEMIDEGRINDLRLSNLMVYMDVLASFNSHHICYKGPCGAGAEFLVVDSDGSLRICDCVLDNFFKVPDGHILALSERVSVARERIQDRHIHLANEGPCRSCPWFNLCGGTCVAKAIGLHGKPNTPYAMECSISRFIYPELLSRFNKAPDSRLFRYHRRHSSLFYDAS